MGWISVIERLPKPYEPCWIYWRDRQVLIGWRVYEKEEEFTTLPHEGWYGTQDEKVRWTHWWFPILKPNNPFLKQEK